MYYIRARTGADFYDTREHPFHPGAVYQLSDKYIVLSSHGQSGDGPRRRSGWSKGAPWPDGHNVPLWVHLNLVDHEPSAGDQVHLGAVGARQHRHLRYSSLIDDNEVRKRLSGRVAVRLLAATRPGSGVQRVLIKLNGYSNPFLGMYLELFPGVKMIRSTRSPLPSLMSFRKITALFYDSLSRQCCGPCCF